MTENLAVLISAALVFYLILFALDRRFGRRLFLRDFNEREQAMAANVAEHKQRITHLEAAVELLGEQTKDKNRENSILLQRIAERDDMIDKLQVELAHGKARLAGLEQQLEWFKARLAEFDKQIPGNPSIAALPQLIVAVGTDRDLALDLASLRAVRAKTGMEFTRIMGATLGNLKAAIDRERQAGRRCNVHLAVHAGPDGVQLGGQRVDAIGLSEVLDSVQILLIAGCSADRVADFLGVVPYTISLSEDVLHTDAAIFTRVFWEGIGARKTPDVALREALDRAPSGMREFVVKSF